MNAVARALMMFLVPVVLSGCVVAIGSDEVDRRGDWAKLERENRDAISTLALGMARAEVEGVMPNAPAMSEAYTSNGSEVTVLFYRTQRVEGDGRTTTDETTPLIFVDDRLDAWGEAAYYRMLERR